LAKSSKLHIKNEQLAGAINLSGLKAKLSRKKEEEPEKPKKKPSKKTAATEKPTKAVKTKKETKEKTTTKKRAAPRSKKVKKEPPVVEDIVIEPQAQLEPIVEEETKVVLEKPEPKPEKLEPKREAPKSKVEKKEPPVFLSALKENPDKLGPVQGKEISRFKKTHPEKPVESQAPKKKPAVKEGVEEEQTTKKKPEGIGWTWRESKGRKKGEEATPGKKGKAGSGKRIDEDARLRRGLHADDDEGEIRRRRRQRARIQTEVQEVVRPTAISVRLPVSVKDLAGEMKVKASQLISALFMQGVVVTLNDQLDDETLVQLLGHDIGCEITIDTSEEERIRITSESVADEIKADDPSNLVFRPPVVTFMGHVDHGKTSIIDAIRKSNIAAGEAGAITQHIGAFVCSTDSGGISIIDTPGHEAFSAMRERGASVTDIAVLVIAGDEGMRDQTYEALNQAREANATIIVALNKSDKPNFDQELIFRQMAECELLPEAWGGQTVTVACSALTKAGIPELLEMISLQAEVLELKANPNKRARGVVIESEMTRGFGPVSTVLVQNGTLRVGDALVFGTTYARVKTMRDDSGKEVDQAGPSIPVRIHGLSGLPSAGEDFIVVESEKEAKTIAEKRQEGQRQLAFQMRKKRSVEKMMEAAGGEKKEVPLIIRADVQGSLDALKTALMKIKSKKVELNIVSMEVGEVSESDVQLAAASKAAILGFHTSVEAHAEPMIKALGVQVLSHDVIYHAQDAIKELMRSCLDKIAEERDIGKAEVRVIFKSSQIGQIAGCMVLDGNVSRGAQVRVIRNGENIAKSSIVSMKRVKDDVKEASKGMECGIILQGFDDFQEGDIFEVFTVTYREQEL